MKKFSLFVLLLMLPLCFAGCQKSDYDLACQNMSEVTEVYFLSTNLNIKGSICVGSRENPYIKDGKHQSTCDFSLISIAMPMGYTNMYLDATVVVNNKESKITLELVGNNYMYDLEYKLKAEDNISLRFLDKEITFAKQDFQVGKDQAIIIGVNELKTVFADKDYSDGKNLKAECYLRILDETGGEFEEAFWCFTLVGQNGTTHNVIISVVDGHIIGTNHSN